MSQFLEKKPLKLIKSLGIKSKILEKLCFSGKGAKIFWKGVIADNQCIVKEIKD